MAGAPLVIASLAIVVSLVGADWASAKARLSYPPVTIILALTMLVLLKHMRLGMQVILEDYVHGEASRIAALLLNTFFTYGVGAVAAYALFKLAFGS
jgi:succinate dehydrogenase / fumarate reductase membrane anchor subunit